MGVPEAAATVYEAPEGAAVTMKVKWSPAATAGRVDANSVAEFKKNTDPLSAAVIMLVAVTTSVKSLNKTVERVVAPVMANVVAPVIAPEAATVEGVIAPNELEITAPCINAGS